jgi:hypothetical protein
MFWFINFLIKTSLLITFLIINEFIDKKNIKKFTPAPAPELLLTPEKK